MQTTKEEINTMTDIVFLSFLNKYPFKSHWENKEAWNHAEYRLALIQGSKYNKTGNINSFRK